MEVLKIDINIITLCRENNAVAQKKLYEICYPVFYKTCIRYTKDAQEAAFVLNEGFFKIFNKIDSYNGKGSFEGWMHRIIINTSLDHIRKNKTTEDISEYRLECNESLIEDEIGIVEMLKKLKSPGKEIFNLFVIEGYSHKEISKMLNISVANSKWHLMVARKKMQKQLKNVRYAY